jgi:hypothetical protein
VNYLSGLASNLNPPDLCLLSSWDCRREPSVSALLEFRITNLKFKSVLSLLCPMAPASLWLKAQVLPAAHRALHDLPVPSLLPPPSVPLAPSAPATRAPPSPRLVLPQGLCTGCAYAWDAVPAHIPMAALLACFWSLLTASSLSLPLSAPLGCLGPTLCPRHVQLCWVLTSRSLVTPHAPNQG